MWVVDCKNGPNSLPVLRSKPSTKWLFSSSHQEIDFMSPLLNLGWSGDSLWPTWQKWWCPSSKPRSQETLCFHSLLESCCCHENKNERTHGAKPSYPGWGHSRWGSPQPTCQLAMDAWETPAKPRPISRTAQPTTDLWKIMKSSFFGNNLYWTIVDLQC